MVLRSAFKMPSQFHVYTSYSLERVLFLSTIITLRKFKFKKTYFEKIFKIILHIIKHLQQTTILFPNHALFYYPKPGNQGNNGFLYSFRPFCFKRFTDVTFIKSRLYYL